MSWDFHKTSEQVASKDYDCDACGNWLSSGLTPGELNITLSDAKTIVIAKKDQYKIKKGQKYFKCIGVYDGDFCVYRARLDMQTLLDDYDFYRDW